jgi:hypothetical protein
MMYATVKGIADHVRSQNYAAEHAYAILDIPREHFDSVSKTQLNGPGAVNVAKLVDGKSAVPETKIVGELDSPLTKFTLSALKGWSTGV